MLNARPAGYYQVFDDKKFHGHTYDGLRGLGATPILANLLPAPPDITGEYNPFSEVMNPDAIKQVLATDMASATSGPPFSQYTLMSWLQNPYVLLGIAGFFAVVLLKGKS